MAKIITAIDNGDLSLETELSNKLFLAGGTTNCPNWQKEIINYIIVGIDKFYDRKIDVTIQTKLSRPDVLIVDSLNKIADWIYNIIYKRSIKNK